MEWLPGVFTYLPTNTTQELVIIGSIFLLISSLECVSLFQMTTNIKRSNYKVCISQMFHAAPLILFRPETSADVKNLLNFNISVFRS